MGKSVRKDVLSFSAHLAPTISLVLTCQEKFDHVLELAWRLRDRASRVLEAHEKGRGGGGGCNSLRTNLKTKHKQR